MGRICIGTEPPKGRKEKKDTKIHVHGKITANIIGTEKTKIKTHKWIDNHRGT